jgi:hypothetical protein
MIALEYILAVFIIGYIFIKLLICCFKSKVEEKDDIINLSEL